MALISMAKVTLFIGRFVLKTLDMWLETYGFDLAHF